MPKRTLPREPSADESDLSSVAEDVLNGDQPVAGADDRVESPRKRRKAVPAPAVKRKTRKQIEVKEELEGGRNGGEDAAPAAPKKTRKRKQQATEEEGDDGAKGEAKVSDTGVKRKRKSKAEKEAELVEMALAARSVGHKLYIGAHVSSAGGRLLDSSMSSLKALAETVLLQVSTNPCSTACILVPMPLLSF